MCPLTRLGEGRAGASRHLPDAMCPVQLALDSRNPNASVKQMKMRQTLQSADGLICKASPWYHMQKPMKMQIMPWHFCSLLVIRECAVPRSKQRNAASCLELALTLLFVCG